MPRVIRRNHLSLMKSLWRFLPPIFNQSHSLIPCTTECESGYYIITLPLSAISGLPLLVSCWSSVSLITGEIGCAEEDWHATWVTHLVLLKGTSWWRDYWGPSFASYSHIQTDIDWPERKVSRGLRGCGTSDLLKSVGGINIIQLKNLLNQTPTEWSING